MIPPVLLHLGADAFSDAIGFILPPAPLRVVLRQDASVRALEQALRHGEVTGAHVRKFVARLMADFRAGEAFRHDLALAGVAAALEHWSDPFAEEYLLDLARASRPELRASFRVARECLKARLAFPRTQIRVTRYPHGEGAPPHVGGIRAAPEAGPAPGVNIPWSRYPEVGRAST